MIAVIFVFNSALAANSDCPSTAPEGPVLGFFKFVSGIISAYALHEAGHAFAASATHTELEWGMGTYNQPLGFTEYAESDTAGVFVHASGLTTQIIVSEVILQADSIDKNDNFVRGMMAWNIFNPIIYAVDYWGIKRTNKVEEGYYQGDIAGVEHYSSGTFANFFAGTMMVMAINQGYRYMKTQTWAPEWMSRDSMRMNFTPHGATGIALKVEMDF
jgi:hypothetical protein